MDLLVITDQAKELAETTAKTFGAAQFKPITNREEYESAADFLKKVKRRMKDIDEMRTSITKPLNAAKKQVEDFFRAPKMQLMKAETAVKASLVTYDNEQERKQREEQKKIAAARAERERKLKAEAEAKALEALDIGDVEAAEKITQEAESLVVVAPVVVKQRVAGVSFREIWKFEIVDFKKLPDEYKLPDEVQLGRIARSAKEGASVPGVRFYAEKVAAA